MNKLMKSNEAVSPVIGVILMVAITVVLAGVVFLLVTRLSSQTGINAPVDVGMSMNQDHTFTINSVEEKISWTNVTIKDNGITQSFTVNGAAPTGTLSAGDLIKVSGLTTGNHNLSMITHSTVFYQTTFVI